MIDWPRAGDTTFCTWRTNYSGMGAADARKRKALEKESRKLRKPLAGSMLDLGAHGRRRRDG
jgi:hypothetical protein